MGCTPSSSKSDTAYADTDTDLPIRTSIVANGGSRPHTEQVVLSWHNERVETNPKMAPIKVPVPGPARLKKSAGPEEWLEAAKNCKYLSEYHMKQLCEIVKEYMMEGKKHSS